MAKQFSKSFPRCISFYTTTEKFFGICIIQTFELTQARSACAEILLSHAVFKLNMVTKVKYRDKIIWAVSRRTTFCISP